MRWNGRWDRVRGRGQLAFGGKGRAAPSWWPFLVVCLLLISGCGASVGPPLDSLAHPGQSGNESSWLARHARRDKTTMLSAGCLTLPRVAPGTSANQVMTSAGLRRSYRVHVPSDYTEGRATPLVLVFHGDGGDGASLERDTSMSALADQAGFLVAYPNGLPTIGGWTAWGGVGRDMPAVDDVRFVSDLLDTLQASYCIDPLRVFAMGFSRGGGMTALLACRLSERIAAIAPVSGSFFSSIEVSCAPTRPVPILDFHGDADRVVPYDGGGNEGFLALPAWLAGWAARDACRVGPKQFPAGVGVAAEEWSGCAGRATVVHYRVEGAGHAWPGGDGAPAAVDADAVAWAFFQAHPLA